MRALLPTLTAGAALLICAPALAQTPAEPGGELAPDLEQEPPSGLVLTVDATGRRAPRYRLGFRSAVRNVGLGPLLIDGRRSSRRTPAMTATQLVQRADGAVDRVPAVGRLRYVVSPDHRHWHLLGFDRYSLRRADGGRTVRRDRKTGFCLGDRYRTSAALAGPSPAAPAFTSKCGLRRPGRLTMSEGISVGYGDDYAANLEGQYLKLNGLPDGRYVLAHEVNANRRLRESSYDNNAASVLLALRWRGGKPDLRVLASCEHTVTCTVPGTTARSAAVPSALPTTARSLLCRLRAPAPEQRHRRRLVSS